MKKVENDDAPRDGAQKADEDPARETRDYLEQWLENEDKQRALRPMVVEMLGTATWQIDAMDALRTRSPSMAREVEGDLKRSLAGLKQVLPLPREYEITVQVSGTAQAVSSNAVLFDALVSVRGSDAQTSPVATQIDRYQDLVAEQGRADEAARRVSLLFPNLGERFTAVKNAVRIAEVSQSTKESAASEMRTFLLKLKGELFAKASKHPRQNMTWELMAEKLSLPSGLQVLLDQGAVHSAITGTLSNILKARPSPFTFSEAWTKFVDHVYVVCGEVLAGTAGVPSG